MNGTANTDTMGPHMWMYMLPIAFVSISCVEASNSMTDAGGRGVIDLPPGRYVDPNHPAPPWVDALAAEPRASATAKFKQLGLDQQIEFAVFMAHDQHPPDMRWSYLLANEGGKIVPALENAIEREPSDEFALGVMEIVHIIARQYGLAEYPTVYRTMRTRVDKIANPTVKWNGKELLARIARDEQQPR